VSDATQQAEQLKPLVVGFLTAIYSSPQPNGRTVHGLSQADFDRVMSGYACGECLAMFDTYMDPCPVCGLSREIGGRVDEDPDQWQAFYDEHLNGTDKNTPRTSLEFLRDIQHDPDVEHAKLSQLRPGSAWRKHRKG
jgi:hypothetical protein